eukprot:3409553-Alexandrium_andersonii.AAC.1
MPILALATCSSRQKPFGSALARAAASPAALFSKQQTDDVDARLGALEPLPDAPADRICYQELQRLHATAMDIPMSH